MAPFLFGSIEPDDRKNQFWFVSAALILLAGFFSLGLSISNPNSAAISKSNYSLTVNNPKYKQVSVKIIENDLPNVFVIKANPKPKIKLVDEQKLKAEAAAKVATQKQREAEVAAQAAQAAALAQAQVQAQTVSYSAPTFNGNLDDLYKRAASAYSLDWRVLAAIHMVETGQATTCEAVSSAGATGPMQFLPSTFNAYAIDADGGGANICDVNDAVFTAANLLASNGGAANITAALYHYNDSDYYVNQVLNLANSL
jgi:membrane-bound lytic murein transglycosylase B